MFNVFNVLIKSKLKFHFLPRIVYDINDIQDDLRKEILFLKLTFHIHIKFAFTSQNVYEVDQFSQNVKGYF